MHIISTVIGPFNSYSEIWLYLGKEIEVYLNNRKINILFAVDHCCMTRSLDLCSVTW